MQKYLVIYKCDSQIGNVGIFEADSEAKAKSLASEQWSTMARLHAYSVEDLINGWSFFV